MLPCKRYLGLFFLRNRNGRTWYNSIWNTSRRGMAKKDNCWMPVCGVVVKKIPHDDTREKCRINSFLMQNLFKDDPLMLAAGMGNNDPDPGLLQHFATIANEGKSLYAMIDMTSEIIGVCLANITNITTAQYLHNLASRLTFEESGRYMKIIATVEERGNVYRAFDTDDCWNVECLITGRTFRRRGIAKLLLKYSRELARKESTSKIMKFFCPNAYGARAAVNCGGMKVHTSKLLSEYKDEKGNTIIPRDLCPPHKFIELYVGNVRSGQ